MSLHWIFLLYEATGKEAGALQEARPDIFVEVNLGQWKLYPMAPVDWNFDWTADVLKAMWPESQQDSII